MKACRMTLCMALAVLVSGICSAAPERVEVTDVYRAAPFKAKMALTDMAEETGRRFDFDDGSMGNFTHFEGVENVRVKDGVLLFTVPTGEAVLGWGNYRGAQEPEERARLWNGRNRIRMRVRQSTAKAVYNMTLWANGEAETPHSYLIKHRATVEHPGVNWRVLDFDASQVGGDGFELTISCISNAVVQIDWIRIMRPEATGCFRRTFEIPEGRQPWRAIGIIASGTTLSVNGTPVPSGMTLRQSNHDAISLDLMPYLNEGRNCLALTANLQETEDVFIYFQGQVILDNGDVINLDGVEDWKARAAPQEGWQEAGFDDGEWEAAEGVTRDEKLWPEWAFTYMLKRSTLYPLAEYDGRIVYRNPDGERLMFRSEKPVRFRVALPAGMAAMDPEIDWTLRRAHRLEETDLKNGTAAEFRKDGDSILFDLPLGNLEQAVYTIETTLKAGGEVIEERYRTPFIVYGRTEQPEVAGTDYLDGLDVELEDTIDFTDPDDPHPWIEKSGETGHNTMTAEQPLVTEPNLVEKDGLKYRETSFDRVTSFFSYQFSFEHPGDWYMLEIDYPSNATRSMGISLSWPYIPRSGMPSKGTPRKDFFTESGPGIITGYHNPVSNTIETFRWLHRAEEGVHTVDLLNVMNNERAAASAFRVYHVRGGLPAMKLPENPQRFVGVHIERPYNLGINFALERPGYHGFSYDAKGVDFMGHYIHRMAYFHETAKHYVEYMRFSGQNFHVFGCYQYHPTNWSYALPNRVASSSQVPCDIRDMLCAYFDANDIGSMSLVEFNSDFNLRDRFNVTDEQMRAGADTLVEVNKDNRQHNSSQLNPVHPIVEQAYRQVVSDLGYKYARWPGWRGVYLMPYTSPWGFGPNLVPANPRNQDPYDVGYSDATVRAFEEETGVDVPGDGPDRFAERHAFLTKPDMLQTWTDWRCMRQARFALIARDELRRYRPDLDCVMANYLPRERVAEWAENPDTSYRDANRRWGFDASMYKEHEGVWYGRYIWPTLPHKNSPHSIRHRTSAEVAADYARDINRIVAIRDDWIERDMIMQPGTDWPWNFTKSRTLPQFGGDLRKECFTQAMIGNDPEIVLFGFADVGEFIGQEQQTREISREIVCLPEAKLEALPETGPEKPLTIRRGKAGERFYFYAANPDPQPTVVQITLQGAGEVFEAATDTPADVRDAGAARTLSVELVPYGMKSFYSDNPDMDVTAWSQSTP